jgi:lambda family phage tail tape measure protein
MATTIDNYKVKVTVEGREGLKNLKKDMEDLGSVGGPLGSTINGIIGKLGPVGVAASIAGAAFVALGSKALRLAGELSDISGATGIAAGTLMNFRQSVVEAGGKAEDFGQIAAKLNQSVQEAASGNETFQKSFQNLGVFVTDANGKIRPTGDILQDIIGKFRNGELTSKQYAAAIDILGKNINKLELSKLQAIADPIKDEQIKQLDKYNDAIDKLAETVNTKLITAFGALAEMINNGLDKLDKLAEKNKELERQANARGNTRQPIPGVPGIGSAVVNPFGIGAPAGERRMTAQELKAFNEAEQARLRAAYRPRPNDRAPGVGPQGDGGFGATPESVIKAREASEKRIADSRIEQERQTQLEINSTRLGAILLFTDQQSAIEQKSESQIREIKINSQAEIAKARLDIFAQEKLSEAEKSKEFAVKEKEIRLKEANEIARARAQLTEQLERERERIQDIITQSKARVTEEQSINSVIEKRNQFLFDNATLSDRERDRAQKLFDLEEERLKVLRQIALIKDIPPEERAKREAEINDIYAKRKGLTIEQQAADRALQENFNAGFQKAYSEYVENSRNYFEQAGRIFNTVTSSMEDAIVEFGKTGKLSFKDFLNTVIEELLRSQARRLIAQTFGAIGNSGGGGGGGFLGKLLGFANGGIIPTNGPVVVGERGPEILMGAAGRQVIPNGGIGGGSVTYNINAVDAMSFKEMVARDPSFIYAVSMQGARTVPGGR